MRSFWASAGGSLGYKPYVMSNYRTNFNPLSALQQVRSDVAVKGFADRLASSSGQHLARNQGIPSAYDLLDAIAESSSNTSERDQKLTAALEAMSPGASGRIQQKAQDLVDRRIAPTNKDALAIAIASESSPLGSLGDSVTEWIARHTQNRNAGGRLLNTFTDWHCSPMSTAVGSAIMSIWTGPAAASAAAAGATQFQGLANCAIWNEALSLSLQLNQAGYDVSREEAIDLIRNGKWMKDANGVWVQTTDFQKFWIVAKPILPFAALALVAMAALR